MKEHFSDSKGSENFHSHEDDDHHHHHHHAEDFTSVAFTLITFIYAGLFIYTRNEPFFWDGVMLSSRVAHFFYSQDLTLSVLPSGIDAGHPPLFGYFLAVLWKVFGSSLLVGHCLVFLLSWLVLWQIKELALYFLPIEKAHWAVWMSALLSPWLAHSTQVSPDVALIAFYLLALVSGLYKRKLWLLLSLILLSLVSTRGFLLAGSLGLLILYWNRVSLQWLSLIVLSILPAGFWYVYHYGQVGWWFTNPNSEWSLLYQSVDFKGFAKNILVLGFRFVDIGMLPFSVLALLTLRKFAIIKSDVKSSQLLILIALPIVVFSCVMLWKVNGIGMRYLLPSFVLLPIFLVRMYELKLVHYLALLALSFSGNFWIYPDGTAKSWDCTLSYLGYDKVRSNTLQWLSKEGIELRKVGSYFPFIDGPLYSHLVSSDALPLTDSARVGVSPFILYSNLCNEERLPMNFFLPNKYILIYRKQEFGVFTEVYKLDTIK